MFQIPDPPRPPTLEVVGSTSSSVTLKWIKNSDVSPVTGEYFLHRNIKKKHLCYFLISKLHLMF